MDRRQFGKLALAASSLGGASKSAFAGPSRGTIEQRFSELALNVNGDPAIINFFGIYTNGTIKGHRTLGEQPYSPAEKFDLTDVFGAITVKPIKLDFKNETPIGTLRLIGTHLIVLPDSSNATAQTRRLWLTHQRKLWKFERPNRRPARGISELALRNAPVVGNAYHKSGKTLAVVDPGVV